MSDYDPKLVHLPGTKLTPEVVLHRTLNKIDDIKAVTVVIQWGNDQVSVDYSQMKVSELCMASVMLQSTASAVMLGEED